MGPDHSSKGSEVWAPVLQVVQNSVVVSSYIDSQNRRPYQGTIGSSWIYFGCGNPNPGEPTKEISGMKGVEMEPGSSSVLPAPPAAWNTTRNVVTR